jgi:hypothetical protein
MSNEIPEAPRSKTVPAACNDCGAETGTEHLEVCDVARCLVTGLQRLMCGADHECGRDVWTGAWPGAAECVEYGWPMFPRASPEELPDLNRLIMQARWDQQARRWRRPGDPVDDTFYVHWHVERGLALPQARYTLDGVTVPEAALPDLLAAIKRNAAPPPSGPANGAAAGAQGAARLEFPEPPSARARPGASGAGGGPARPGQPRRSPPRRP